MSYHLIRSRQLTRGRLEPRDPQKEIPMSKVPLNYLQSPTTMRYLKNLRGTLVQMGCSNRNCGQNVTYSFRCVFVATHSKHPSSV